MTVTVSLTEMLWQQVCQLSRYFSSYTVLFRNQNQNANLNFVKLLYQPMHYVMREKCAYLEALGKSDCINNVTLAVIATCSVYKHRTEQ